MLRHGLDVCCTLGMAGQGGRASGQGRRSRASSLAFLQ